LAKRERRAAVEVDAPAQRVGGRLVDDLPVREVRTLAARRFERLGFAAKEEGGLVEARRARAGVEVGQQERIAAVRDHDVGVAAPHRGKKPAQHALLVAFDRVDLRFALAERLAHERCRRHGVAHRGDLVLRAWHGAQPRLPERRHGVVRREPRVIELEDGARMEAQVRGGEYPALEHVALGKRQLDIVEGEAVESAGRVDQLRQAGEFLEAAHGHGEHLTQGRAAKFEASVLELERLHGAERLQGPREVVQVVAGAVDAKGGCEPVAHAHARALSAQDPCCDAVSFEVALHIEQESVERHTSGSQGRMPLGASPLKAAGRGWRDAAAAGVLSGLGHRQPMPPPVVNLAEKFGRFSEYWTPKIAAQVNDTHIKLVKFKGEFVWHQHEKEDEMFLVVKGRLVIHIREGGKEYPLRVGPGEFVVIPKGMEHKPVAAWEVEVVLVEPTSTLNTGNVRNEWTRPVLDRA
jgi:mannose-6-phosphate isomerase-like protein (cupin superfamily)